jgi:hypothetical protein
MMERSKYARATRVLGPLTLTRKKNGSTVARPKKLRQMWCKCGALAPSTSRWAPISAPHSALTCHFFGADDGIRTRDPHLGNVFRPTLLTCAYSNRRSELADSDGPGLSASDHHCQRRVVFPWCGCQRISHHVHHITAVFGENNRRLLRQRPRRGTSPSVASRLSNSLTPRAPCRWRAVVGGMDQRSTAGASPNHRRLPLGFGHLPSPPLHP